MTIEEKISIALGRLAAAVKLFDPIEVFGLYSGGHDSFSEEKVRVAGFPWGWEDAPPVEYLEEKRGQIIMPEMKQYLCWSCNAKRA